MHSLKLDKISNKNSQVVVFHTSWPKLFVISEPHFKHAQNFFLKNIEMSLKGL